MSAPDPRGVARAPADSQWPRWEVFKQDAEGRPHQAVGSVHAADAEHALLMARSVFARRPAAVSLWVVPADAVYAVTAEQLAAEGGAAETGVAEGNAAEGISGHPATRAVDTAAGAAPGRAASAAPADAPAGSPPAGPDAERYLVFRKTSHRRSMTFVDHAGEVSASGPSAAVAAARAAFPEPPALAWWVVPVARVVASPEAEAAAWFDPATSKTYKQQSEYGTLPATRRNGERR